MNVKSIEQMPTAYQKAMLRKLIKIVDSKSILLEAQKITDGNRKSDYGDVEESFNIISDIACILGANVSKTDVCKVMIAVKLSREAHKHKKDNLVDLCGYARLLSILEGDEK